MPRKTRKARPKAHEAFDVDEADDGDENFAESDEDKENEKEKKIRAKAGRLGFYYKNFFDARTNFTLEVKADIYSKAYQLKGNIFIVRIGNYKADSYIIDLTSRHG